MKDFINTASLPLNWEIIPNRALFQEVNIRGGDEQMLSVSQSNGIIPQSNFLDNSSKKDTSNEDKSNYKLVTPGDFAYNKMRMWQGAIGLSEHTGLVSPAYIVFRAIKPIHGKFFFYTFKTTLYNKASYRYSYGIHDDQLSLRFKDFKNIYTITPPLETQRQIAAYLDRKTEAIDALISKKQRLIELLEEKRTALLENLLGQLSTPHIKLSRVIDLLPGYAFPSNSFLTGEEGIPLLRGINLKPGELSWSDTVKLPKDMAGDAKAFALKPGDIVIGMDRPWISSGLRIKKIEENDCPCILSQRVARIRTKKELNKSYLMLNLEWKRFKAHLEPEMTGVSIPHISGNQISSYNIPLPKLHEQENIVTTVDATCNVDKITIRCINLQIEKLQEYRQALITAAVTGQLDLDNDRISDDPAEMNNEQTSLF